MNIYRIILLLIMIILLVLLVNVCILSPLPKVLTRKMNGGGMSSDVSSDVSEEGIREDTDNIENNLSTNWPDPCRFNHLLDGGIFPGTIPSYEDARQALLRIGVETNGTKKDLFNKVEQYFPRDGNSCDLDPNCGWCSDKSEDGGKCLSISNSSTCPKDQWWNGWKDSCSFRVESVDNKKRDDQNLVRDPTRDEVRWELLLKGETVDSNDNELEEKAARFLPRDQQSCSNQCGWCVGDEESRESDDSKESEADENSIKKKLSMGKCVHKDTSDNCPGWWEGVKCIKGCQTMTRLQKHRREILNRLKGFERNSYNSNQGDSEDSDSEVDDVGEDRKKTLCQAYSDLSERNGIPDCQYDMYDSEGVCQISDTGLDVKNKKISCKDACQNSISGYGYVTHQYCPVKLRDNRSVGGERCYCLRYGKESE